MVRYRAEGPDTVCERVNHVFFRHFISFNQVSSIKQDSTYTVRPLPNVNNECYHKCDIEK